MPRQRSLPVLFTLAATAVIGCSPTGATNTSPPSPPAPVPLTLVINPASRKATAQPGSAAPSDNAAITLTGDHASAATWSATTPRGWTTLTSSSGAGSGSVSWTRSMAGLTPGIYVDTITVTVAGAVGSPAIIVDSLLISTVPVPLTLVVGPHSRSAAVVQGAVAPDDNVAITLTGDAAATTAWSASGAGAWTTFVAGSGSGSGTLSWHRSTAGLAIGTYVDTLTIAASGAAGSPSSVIDTLRILPIPVPLTLALSPPSHSVSAVQGSPAASATATVTLAGDNSSATSWIATKRKTWTTLTTSSGTGTGTLAWSRNTTGLAPGIYVDTISVAATGAAGSPASTIDTLTITASLTLAVSPASRSITVAQGSTAAGATAAVTITGNNASATSWSAAKRKSWTTLTTGSGTGSGTVAWSRSTSGLIAGTYVDTISVTAAGVTGSPATVVDTLVITAVSGGSTPDLGLVADLHGKRPFPATDLWNQPVDTAQVDPNSLAILTKIGLGVNLHPDFGSNWNGGPFGIPYIVVPDNTPRFTVPFDYASESDPGPYPIPPNPPLEGGGVGDSHLLVITQNEWKLYEMYAVRPVGAGWAAGSGAIFDLTNNTKRPAGWTSADAAGLPIFPGLVRYDEVYLLGAINHALRFTVQHTQHAYVAPASHMASSNTDPLTAPMGMRVRLKASFDISGYPAPCQVILRALQKYGMMVADNGSNFFVSGTADARWDDTVNNLLKQVHVSDFEVIRMTGVVTH
jgi:hypothetical protein